jgi:hypothetical protein
MAFSAGLSCWNPRGGRARAPHRARPCRPVRLAAELLEDRTLPSAGARMGVLPRLSGGPLQGMLRQGAQPQAFHVTDTLTTGGQGPGGVAQGGQQTAGSGQTLDPLQSGSSVSGPGYPVPDPFGLAFRNELPNAVQPRSVLNPAAPSGQVVQGFPMSPNPMLFTGSAGTPETLTPFPAASGFRVPGAVEVSASGVRPASAEADGPAGPAGQGRLASALVMARTDDTSRGVRTDAPTDLRPRAEWLDLAAENQDPWRATSGPVPFPGGVEEWAFVQALLPEAAERAVAPAGPGQAPVNDAQADDLAGLFPLDYLEAPAALPGAPNLATSLSPLAPEGRQPAPGSAGSATFRNLVLGSLFAVGCLGLGQFRDSFSRKASPENVPGLRPREEEDQ